MDQVKVLLGNCAPMAAELAETVTQVFIARSWSDPTVVNAFLGLWPCHSTEPPMWVWSEDERMASLAMRALGCPPIGGVAAAALLAEVRELTRDRFELGDGRIESLAITSGGWD